MNDNTTTQVATLVPDMFKDINFSELNNVITALGNNNKGLSDKEKEFAVEAINTWEESVIDKIEYKRKEAKELLYILNVNTKSLCTYSCQEELLEELISVTGLQAFYDEYLNKMDILELHNSNAPQLPIVDELNTTTREQMITHKNYELSRAIHEKERVKLERDAYNSMYKLKAELNNNEKVQELIKRLKKYERKTSSFIRQCKEKSQLAKISVSIESEDIKTSLKELMNFSISI